MGNEIGNKKFPTPNAPHPGIGLNFGEWYSNVLDANDSLIVAQGIMDDEYNGVRVENAFIRSVDQNMLKKDYSSDFDSTQMEYGARLVYNNDRIVLFGSRSDDRASQYFGDIFAREYSTSCDLVEETIYPRVSGTLTLIRQVVDAPGGGWLLVGSNDQYPISDLVSENNPVLMMINPDLTMAWSREVSTGFPAKGYDAVFHPDGTIGLIVILKDKFRLNKLLYAHLNGNGDIINN